MATVVLGQARPEREKVERELM
ncbi:hypothetical protein M6B38_101755 [Iris pallida]|uniref:Uncharacterized protein n=1 Tax=Iris pallida TaxID=29817 RepID=A0AAX6H6J1_IRIPA|nr:hypothetical protein M6B38_326920 [Iris pallida]KAJ6854182.1 hypothetical protein M6B38_101755 [Iris pallida]